jgi:hypothetical protein
MITIRRNKLEFQAMNEENRQRDEIKKAKYKAGLLRELMNMLHLKHKMELDKI